MKRVQLFLVAAALTLSAFAATPAMAYNSTVLPNWYGFIGGPRVCDDVNPDGWCVSWHWDLKESDRQRAQRNRSHRRAQMERLRAQDAELNFRPAEPRVLKVDGDTITEESGAAVVPAP